ncbi:CPBP family intramembrane glutamic endopeptidase [uncultured Algimonas sp.]|uniref:CPBP family intramembrane glutamic endopeptidase n=1 Tax=uncultured Algimonas sp. TaxID=1547920 RepID=UPI002626A6A9|nr:CPBP family intramembrane glutamic endopeptidase [uncultured Algimonas sp.]
MSTAYSIPAMMRYVRRPYFPAGRDPVGEEALRHLTQLLFLSLAVMLLVSSMVGAVVSGVLGDVPENINDTVGRENPAQLLFYGVILAPIVEELLFRSWLGGRRACIIGLPVLLSFYAVSMAVAVGIPAMTALAMAGGLSALIYGVARRFLRLSVSEQKAARWRLFPAAFYGSAMLFGLLHLTNFDGGLSSPVMLIAVLPQALVGLVLGYVRMRFGLFAAMIFHALYNLVLIGLFLTAMALTPVESAALVPVLH